MPLDVLPHPKSALSKVGALIKGTIMIPLFFVPLLIINLIQSLSVLLLPISRQWVRSINRACAGGWWTLCDLLAKHAYGIEIVIEGDELPLQENIMVVANHQSMPDINTLFRLARQQRRIGDIKWFVKDIIKYIPGIGWGMIFLDCIFLKRDWQKDRVRLKNQLKRFEDEQIPIWTISFIEGTRFTAAKHKKSVEYAAKQGIEPHNHLLIPRVKGFNLTLDSLRSHLDGVYDVTIGYVEGVPTLWQWVSGQVKRVNIYVRRYPIDSIPEGDEALTKWIKERWYEKDVLLEKYYESGQWT